jgi:hypothetical protein
MRQGACAFQEPAWAEAITETARTHSKRGAAYAAPPRSCLEQSRKIVPFMPVSPNLVSDTTFDGVLNSRFIQKARFQVNGVA